MAQEPGLVVVDASVVLKWQFEDEECTTQATALRDDYYYKGDIHVIAPQLLIYEMVNSVVTARRQKRIPQEKVIDIMKNLIGFGVELKEVEPLRILETALKYRLSAYDAAYLALAEDEKCDLWTGDRNFYQAVRSESFPINWIGDYRAE